MNRRDRDEGERGFRFEGMRAYGNGLGIRDNPWPAGSRAHQLWKAGWEYGEQIDADRFDRTPPGG